MWNVDQLVWGNIGAHVNVVSDVMTWGDNTLHVGSINMCPKEDLNHMGINMGRERHRQTQIHRWSKLQTQIYTQGWLTA